MEITPQQNFPLTQNEGAVRDQSASQTAVDSGAAKQARAAQTPSAGNTVRKGPFTGDLKTGGIRAQLEELFEAARAAAEAGRILPRGSFLNVVV